MALKCTKTSPPSSFSIKPNPFFSLNHFTLPSAKAVHPPFLRFVQAGFASWRHKKTTPSQNRVLNRWWLHCLQDRNTQLFPAPPFFVISSNPTYELFPGRMFVPNIDFLKMQAFFINRSVRRAKEPASEWRGPEPYFFPFDPCSEETGSGDGPPPLMHPWGCRVFLL